MNPPIRASAWPCRHPTTIILLRQKDSTPPLHSNWECACGVDHRLTYVQLSSSNSLPMSRSAESPAHTTPLSVCPLVLWTPLRFQTSSPYSTSPLSGELAILTVIYQASQPRGLLLNVKKTQIMVIDNNRLDHTDFMIYGERISEVEEFVYLGSNITKECSCRTEVRRRLAMARTATLNMTSIWKSRGVSTKLKTRLLQATTFDIASYGCESWAMTKADQGKVDAFEMWAYRRVLRVSWTAMKTNKWVLDKIGKSLVLRSQMMERKLKFFGHVMRHERFEKGIIQGMIEAKRKRGRPPREWMDDIKGWTGLSVAAASSAAQNRQRWRGLVRATAARIAAQSDWEREREIGIMRYLSALFLEHINNANPIDNKINNEDSYPNDCWMAYANDHCQSGGKTRNIL